MSVAPGYYGLSETAVKVMRYVRRNSPWAGATIQIAGNGRAPWLSSCRALVKRGYMHAGHRTGHYGLTEAGGMALARHELAEPKVKA